MNPNRTILRSLLTGALAGAVILGLAGRFVMAGIAALTGAEINWSPRGLIEVVILGAIVGGVGGLIFIPIGKWMGAGKIMRGLVLGAVLFIFSLMFSMLGWEWSSALVPILAITLFAAAAVYVLFGIIMSFLLSANPETADG